MADVTLKARTTLQCAAVMFTFSPTNLVTYFHLNAVDVSRAVAKSMLAKAGMHDGIPPAGWTYVGIGA